LSGVYVNSNPLAESKLAEVGSKTSLPRSGRPGIRSMMRKAPSRARRSAEAASTRGAAEAGYDILDVPLPEGAGRVVLGREPAQDQRTRPFRRRLAELKGQDLGLVAPADRHRQLRILERRVPQLPPQIFEQA